MATLCQLAKAKLPQGMCCQAVCIWGYKTRTEEFLPLRSGRNCTAWPILILNKESQTASALSQSLKMQKFLCLLTCNSQGRVGSHTGHFSQALFCLQSAKWMQNTAVVHEEPTPYLHKYKWLSWRAENNPLPFNATLTVQQDMEVRVGFFSGLELQNHNPTALWILHFSPYFSRERSMLVSVHQIATLFPYSCQHSIWLHSSGAAAVLRCYWKEQDSISTCDGWE